MSDSELTPGALGYFLNKPVDGDVKAGARGVQFELIVSALSATPVHVNKIQIQIPSGSGVDKLAVANSLDIDDLPHGWLPDVKPYNHMIILDLVCSAGCLISQSNTARFRFSINVNSQPGLSHILISESLFRDGQYVSSGATKELWVKKYDRLPFSVSYLKCTPELFVVGEKLQLQFQIAGALPEDKLRFNIVYPNKHGNPILRPFVYKPNEDPKGFKYNQGCVTVSLSSDELNEKEITKFASHLATMPTRGLGLTKKAVNLGLFNSLEDQLDVEERLQTEAGETDDFAEGVNAFLQKRAPIFKGK